ncbi:MAG: hypothetical protein LBR08_05995 [Bacteroidales bacterium]|nr:hypothetical protein [Bacteroidales bacterium]
MKTSDYVVKSVKTSPKASWNELLVALSPVKWTDIGVVNWKEYPYRPWVQFRMACSGEEFLLQYQVREKYIRAMASGDNGEVWKDSCVEFFVSPFDDGIYYNFEFNCAGVCLLAAGAGRNEREKAPLEIVAEIRRLPSLGRAAFQERKGEAEWNLLLAIPYACLFKHPQYTTERKSMKANFYKCGDDLTEPHFLSWRPVKTDKPDFHRPEFFGNIRLAVD